MKRRNFATVFKKISHVFSIQKVEFFTFLFDEQKPKANYNFFESTKNKNFLLHAFSYTLQGFYNGFTNKF